MAITPKPGVSYNKDTNTVSIDQTVAGGATTKDVESVAGKVNLENTQYGTKMDPSTGAPEKITTNTPVINTNNVRNQAQENAKLVEDKAGTKKVISTVTSNGKITKTYSDGTTDVTESGISGETGTPDRRQILDEQKNIYTDQEKLQADVAQRYDNLKVSQDEAYNQLVENTKNQFASLRTKLTDSNRRFEMRTAQGQYLNNGFRYTPQSSEGMVYQAEQAGIARLSDLNLQESIALQKALSAKNDSDYQGLQDYTNQIRGIQQERLATLDSMNTQIKNIEDTDKNIRNMNQNEAKMMQSMIDSYILTAGATDASKTDEYYQKKSEELSELMGFNVAPEFIKAQVEGASEAAKLEVNENLSKANGFYTDAMGRPVTDKDGKSIPMEKEDWLSQVVGTTLNVGTYDENGNKVIKTYELKGETKSYADTLKDLPPTAINIKIQDLVNVYKGANPAILNAPDGSLLKTRLKEVTNPNGGKECAEYVNDIMGAGFGNMLTDKLKVASDTTGQVGSAAVWDPANTGKYGHVGIIVGEEGNNWIVKSSNFRSDGKISTDIVPKSAIKGYYTPDSVKNLPNEISGVYDPLKDTKLTPIGQNADGSGIYLDTRTNQTISEEQAKAMYGQTTQGEIQGSNYTSTQQNVMDTITGDLTGPKIEQLKNSGLTVEDYANYRAKKQSMSTALSDDQRSIYNSEKSRYNSNPVVKTFEENITQLNNSISSLSDKSGPGDIAGVYQFMKTLDPTSVVRETEFNIAAKSAGVLPYIGNTWNRLENGEVLTEKQREAFAKLMKVYTQNKASQYNRIYDDLERVLRLSGIPPEYMPTRATVEGGATTTTEGQNMGGEVYADFSTI